jgi:DNA-binding beta-propeller fold protein YncE
MERNIMNKKWLHYLGILLVAMSGAGAVALILPPRADASDDGYPGRIIVGNRGSGTISVIDPWSNEVVGTPALPPGPTQPETMYVVDGGFGRVLVGDRANNRVVVFDRRSFRVRGTVPAGNGVFHMWASQGRQQLWVNNDVDKTSTVIDLRSLTVMATVPMPADLVDKGGKPHDVILDPHHGRYAYVTMTGLPGPDYVVKFSTESFEEIDRAEVGDDPHLGIDDRFEQLFVPSQGSNLLQVLDTGTLDLLESLSIPATHGAGMMVARNRFYTTNISGGGVAALFTIDTKTRTTVGEPVDAPFATPHNVALTPDGGKLFLTHSGSAANQVSIYRTHPRTGVPEFEETVIVGTNPFAIAFVR